MRRAGFFRGREGIGGRLALGLAAAGALHFGYARFADERFDRAYPGFVEGNVALRRILMRRPRSRARDEQVAAVGAKLRWAEAYRRLGFDPELLDELRREKP